MIRADLKHGPKYRRVLITGGAGFIGSQLVLDLIARGQEVSVIDDLSTGLKSNLGQVCSDPLLRFYEGSILSPERLEEAGEGCDAVVHLAVSNLRRSIKSPALSFEVNTRGSFELLELCRKRDFRRFVYVSSSEVYGSAVQTPMSEKHPLNPTTVYASSKIAGEHFALSYAKMYGINATVVRPFNNYGPRSHYERENGEFIPRSLVRLKNGLPPLIFGDGKQTRDFQYVRDTAFGLQLILDDLDAKGEVFNLGFGREVSIWEVAEHLCKVIDPSLRPRMVGSSRPGDLRRHFSDSSKFFSRYGTKPSTSLEDGIADYLKWMNVQKLDYKAMLSEVRDENW